ncbi:MAG: hypothetical protein JWP97_2900 [Labilithrix sp.]|nr:hypothetical protein [Labilithrix sp.]
MKRLVAALFAVLVLTSLTGCLGAKQSWTAQPVATAEARIAPQEVYRRKNRLFVRVTYTNLSNENVTIDRDAVSLQLASGRVAGRSSGTFTQHHPYTLPPNAAHSIYVDFQDEEIADGMQSGAVLWNGAIFAGAREVHLPPTPVTAR